MKKVLFVIPIILLFVLLSAKPYFGTQVANSDVGIKFTEGTWADILAKSKKEHKPIFLDASTSWCGWCKRLKATTFVDKDVANFFNKNYINYEIDAEHGEGLTLSKKYRINNFPTLVFIDANEKSLMFSEGYLAAPDLLKLGKQVIDKNK